MGPEKEPRPELSSLDGRVARVRDRWRRQAVDPAERHQKGRVRHPQRFPERGRVPLHGQRHQRWRTELSAVRKPAGRRTLPSSREGAIGSGLRSQLAGCRVDQSTSADKRCEAATAQTTNASRLLGRQALTLSASAHPKAAFARDRHRRRVAAQPVNGRCSSPRVQAPACIQGRKPRNR